MCKLIIKNGNVSKEYHVQTFEELKEIEKLGECKVVKCTRPRPSDIDFAKHTLYSTFNR